MSEFPEPSMELTHLLVVSDIDESRRWYTEVLGAELYREYGGSSVVLKLLGSWLLLVTGGGPTADKPGVHMVTPDPANATGELIFRVGDCRASYATLSSRGAVFLTPPVDNGYEIRAFFQDPDGHLFEISEIGR